MHILALAHYIIIVVVVGRTSPFVLEFLINVLLMYLFIIHNII